MSHVERRVAAKSKWSSGATSSGKRRARKRILYILPSINPVTGGPARSIPLQIAALARQGYEIDLYTTWWPDAEAAIQLPEVDSVAIHVFPSETLPLLNHVPYSRSLIEAVRESRARFDIFHACSLWNPLISHTIALLRRAGAPYAITCHGMLDPVVFERNRLQKLLWAHVIERRNVEHAALLHFTSEAESAKATECGWNLPPRLVMPVSVNLSFGDILPLRSEIEQSHSVLAGREVVLFVGRINWVKNLHLLLEAISRLFHAGRDVILLCVGPDSDNHQARLTALARELGVIDRVIFTGLLQGRDLLAAFARADTLTLVSKKENFGQAAAEALVSGVPIVLSDGVDIGKDWPMPPVWRVRPTAVSIAEGLNGALDYTRKGGVPSQAARDLARREWAEPPVADLAAAYESIVSNASHRPKSKGR